MRFTVTGKETWVKNRFSLFWKRVMDDLSSIRVSAVFLCLALIAVINGPANRLLAQVGAKNSAAERRACFPVECFSLRHFPQIKFRIIMSFRKPCHMPFHKLIPPFTLTGSNVNCKLQTWPQGRGHVTFCGLRFAVSHEKRKVSSEKGRIIHRKVSMPSRGNQWERRQTSVVFSG